MGTNEYQKNLFQSLGFDIQQSLSFDISSEAPHGSFLEDFDIALFKGDNIKWLKTLTNNKAEFVDLIYIDPPYNTHSNFLYDDSRKGHGGIPAFGQHSAWMEFMLNRLIIARDLLKSTGILAVSIDDYEQPYLRILLDNLFGEANFIANIVVTRSKNGKGSNKSVATNHEYLLVYGKSSESALVGIPALPDDYTLRDEHGFYKVDGLFRKKGDASRREDRPNMFYPLYVCTESGNVFTQKIRNDLLEIYPVDSKGVERRWLWGADKAKNDSWMLYGSKKGVIYVKNYFNDQKRIKPRSIWDDNRYLTERATNEIKEIYGSKIFDTPKPLGFMEDIIQHFTHKEAIILDFFAGSGTTAHAACNLNNSDGGNRKVILMEDMHTIKKNHAAYKAGFLFGADITAQRIKYIQETNQKELLVKIYD
ncbi:TPA: site-specific DNA-methyltransferase [Aeromonas hydrophila subsp. hydrophila]|nr:site-specific DNA-methyltransferase [Aeromonas hydrophila subsp. hydrophila]HEB5047401.1 site-specific DNA-methyltransferase [Aeromonas hydrophila subsp. hydrophila]